MLTASEGLAALARHGVELPSALQAINGPHLLSRPIVSARF
jgi:hypothetical protein